MKSAAESRPILSEQECFTKLVKMGQEHLLDNIPCLSQTQKMGLIEQIARLDTDLFYEMRDLEKNQGAREINPFHSYHNSGDEKLENKGKILVQEGRVALVVLAGGQGSRLGYPGPKGCVPVTLIKQKSLFQLLAEKVHAAGLQAERPLHVAIMTSPLNHRETEFFFAQHEYFGLEPNQLKFFTQNVWPLLDLNENLFLESPSHIAFGPNGNGAIFKRLVETGIWEKWNECGIEMVNVVPVDNPLADPFDFELFGAHAEKKSDITLKVALRKDPHEPVGILAESNDKAVVVEYTEMSLANKEAQDERGNLKFGLANLGLLCFSMPFISKVAQHKLPLHRAKKKVATMMTTNECKHAWKFEQFIFDALPFADRIQAIVYPRSTTFAPLKNLEGEDTIEHVQAALLNFDKQRYEKVTGLQSPSNVRFELGSAFYYPTAKMLKKWKRKPFPSDKEYIDE